MPCERELFWWGRLEVRTNPPTGNTELLKNVPLGGAAVLYSADAFDSMPSTSFRRPSPPQARWRVRHRNPGD